MFDRDIYDETRREFLAHLRYTKGHRVTTCYAYHSDLGIWRTGCWTPARTGSGRGRPTWSSTWPGSCGNGRSAPTSSTGA
jgi:hypothetical protein